MRSYLIDKAKIFDWKTTRTVLDNILRYFKDSAQKHNNKHAETIANYQKDLEERYEDYLRKFARAEGIQAQAVLEMDKIKLRKFAARTFRPSPNQKRETGKELFEEFMRNHAFPDPDFPENRRYDPTKPKHVSYWELSTVYLDSLIEWRREAGKRPGGVKSLDGLE